MTSYGMLSDDSVSSNKLNNKTKTNKKQRNKYEKQKTKQNKPKAMQNLTIKYKCICRCINTLEDCQMKNKEIFYMRFKQCRPCISRCNKHVSDLPARFSVLMPPFINDCKVFSASVSLWIVCANFDFVSSKSTLDFWYKICRLSISFFILCYSVIWKFVSSLPDWLPIKRGD